MDLHIGTLSSGAGSAYACKLMIEEVGLGDNVMTIFTDTKVEDEDNYRFLDEIVAHLPVPHYRLSEGRTPLELAWSEKALPNNRIPFCSRKLKREPLERFVQELRDEGFNNINIWWGIDNEEAHRAVKIGENWLNNFNVFSRFPLIEQGTIHSEPFEWLENIGVKRPRMYDEGFTHANCGNQGCVRAGLNHWRTLYEQRPEVYARTEAIERQWQQDFGKENTILKKSIEGQNQPISLEDFRIKFLEPNQIDFDDPIDGACGCMAVYEGD